MKETFHSSYYNPGHAFSKKLLSKAAIALDKISGSQLSEDQGTRTTKKRHQVLCLGRGEGGLSDQTHCHIP